jgi:hypothetical protein
MSILSSPVTFAPSSVRRISGLDDRPPSTRLPHLRAINNRQLIAAVEVENHRQRLLVLQQEELVRKLAREVEAARASADDQPEPGDHSVGDEGRGILHARAIRLTAAGERARRGPIEDPRLPHAAWTR